MSRTYCNSGDLAARRGAAGIPDGYGRPRLLYNPASESVLFGLWRDQNEFRCARLFIRHKDVEVYKLLGDPAEDASYESAVTCEKRPVVVFNHMTRTKTGGNWAGL